MQQKVERHIRRRKRTKATVQGENRELTLRKQRKLTTERTENNSEKTEKVERTYISANSVKNAEISSAKI